MKNKKGSALLYVGITIAVLFAIALISFFSVFGMYNTLVGHDTNAEKQWGNVQSAYQRRADLIPNLVATVKGAAAFEKSTFVEVTEARTRWMASQAGGSQTEQLQAANGLDSALARLLVTFESYPTLQANQNFLALQDELAGTENRIKYERDNYNEEVRKYKLAVRSFPTNILAGMFGFEADKWMTFQATSDAQNAPEVSFE